ncbi:Squamous cell carcinoma antigen recognized by T-cells 3 [Trichinella pseudospiralis]|uniref:Squamous cell carcinoma antigen recognized by T-cells 3 n=3 Tax=Trichinella pseudospiralis TaxID=6337 RepID=A0A0V1JA14_TRIPS|nr:Squamous cell carcinoma antigen recognized by T-cells 3 [Trichinella pseudospiralis]
MKFTNIIMNQSAEDMEELGEELNDMDFDSHLDNELEVQLTNLRQMVTDNPTSFSAYNDLVQALKCAGELIELRETRREMSRRFVLLPNVWLEWIGDELELGTPTADILSMFEQGLKDFPASLHLWMEYLNLYCTASQPDEMRNCIEQAVTAVGLNVAEASTIWQMYRDFEMAMTPLQQPNGSSSTPSDEKAQYLSVFRRQLSVPHIGLREAYEEYKDLLNGAEVDKATEFAYRGALKELEMLENFEKQLESYNGPRSSKFSAYIDFEMKQKCPARLQALFERAILHCYTDETLWLRYLNWLNENMTLPDVTLPVYGRAVRSCPRSMKIRQMYLLACERFKCDWSTISKVMTDALEISYSQLETVELLLTHIYQRKRFISTEGGQYSEVIEASGFKDGAEILKDRFHGSWDADFWYRQSWARFAADDCKDMNAARLLWKEIMHEAGGTNPTLWLDYVWLERQHGDFQHVCSIYQQAANSLAEHHAALFAEWQQYVNEKGTLDDVLSTMRRIERHRMRLKESQNKGKLQRKKQQQISKKPTVEQEETTPAAESLNSAMQRDGVSVKPYVSVGEKASSLPSKDYFKKDSLGTTATVVREPTVQVDADGFLIPPVPKKTKTESQAKQAEVFDQPTLETTNDTSAKHANTVFVSNLDFTLSKERLKDTMAEAGEVVDVRMIMLRPNRSKGYAYVDYKDEASVKKALKMDRRCIDGRPMYVSVCRGDVEGGQQLEKQNSGFQYSVGLEKNKLFVKNIPTFATENEVETLFRQYGDLRSVRLVLHKSGKSKGLAYVEFDNEEAAERARLAQNGAHFLGKRLSVEFSNPPPRQDRSSSTFTKKSQNPSSGGGGPSRSADVPRSAPRLRLVPRALSTSQKLMDKSNSMMLSLSAPDSKEEEELIAPFRYICSIPGKQIRVKLVCGFNLWLNVDNEIVNAISEIVEMLHNASLMIDDIEDSSELRRGMPVTHRIYGLPTTLNTANYIYFVALSKTVQLHHTDAVKVFTESLLDLHRGQGMEIFWRDAVICPTEAKYLDMVIKKTGGLFRLGVNMLQLFSSNKMNYNQLLNDMATYFQIRDDYMNLVAGELKGFAEDLTEGKFSFPIIHALQSHPENDQILKILRQRTNSVELKKHCINMLSNLGSLDYTKQRLNELSKKILSDIEKFGGNAHLQELMDMLKQLHTC